MLQRDIQIITAYFTSLKIDNHHCASEISSILSSLDSIEKKCQSSMFPSITLPRNEVDNFQCDICKRRVLENE